MSILLLLLILRKEILLVEEERFLIPIKKFDWTKKGEIAAAELAKVARQKCGGGDQLISPIEFNS